MSDKSMTCQDWYNLYLAALHMKEKAGYPEAVEMWDAVARKAFTRYNALFEGRVMP